MLIVNKDEELKGKYTSIVNKCESEDLSDKEWDKVIQEELIPLAKATGFDISLEDFKSLQKLTAKNLADDELEQIVGGMGKFVKYVYKIPSYLSCELAPNDQTFINYYNANNPPYEGNGCLNFAFDLMRLGSNPRKACVCCKHLHIEY